MTRELDYFMATASPWTYLGHQRLLDLCARHHALLELSLIHI